MKNKISIIKLAKLQALLFLPLGILAGLIYSFGGLIYDLVKTRSVNIGTFLAFFSIIGMPLVFYVIGFILGMTEAYMFNTLLEKFIEKIIKICAFKE